MKENSNINPEDYWKGAEKLLDQHFNKKRKGGILLFFIVLFFSSMGLYTILNTNHVPGNTRDTLIEGLRFTNGQIKNENKTSSGSTDSQPAYTKRSDLYNSMERNPDIKELKNKNAVEKNRSQILSEINFGETGIVRNKIRQPLAQYKIARLDLQKAVALNSSITMANQFQFTPPLDTATVANLQPVDSGLISVQNNTIPLNFSLMTFRPSSISKKEFEEGINFSGNIKKQSRRRLDLIVFTGPLVINKITKGNEVATYLNRRNKEEHSIISPDFGFQFSDSRGNWDIRAGVELAVLGQKTEYSPHSNGEYYNTYKDWQNIQYTVSDTDSTYLYGILFLQTKIVTVDDSILVTVTDTLNGDHYDKNIQSANGNNQYYVLEIPLEVTYQFSRGQFGLGISAGIAPGLVIKSKGNYLKNDESSTSDMNTEQNRQFTLNARAGFEISYLLNERFRLLLRPSGRIYLTDIREKYGAKNRYTGFGLNLGVLYNLK